MTRILLSSALLLMLSGCGGDPQGKSTTKLDAVEVQPGTISDSMIILDDVNSDGTAVDNSVPSEKAKDEAAAPDEKDDADAEATSEADPREEMKAVDSAPPLVVKIARDPAAKND